MLKEVQLDKNYLKLIFAEIEKTILISPYILPELLSEFKDELKIEDGVKLLNNTERESIFNKIPQAYIDSKLKILRNRRDYDIRINKKYNEEKEIVALIKNRQANEIIKFTERYPHWSKIIQNIEEKRLNNL